MQVYRWLEAGKADWLLGSRRRGRERELKLNEHLPDTPPPTTTIARARVATLVVYHGY